MKMNTVGMAETQKSLPYQQSKADVLGEWRYSSTYS